MKTVLNKSAEQIATEHINDIDKEVAIKSAWLMTLNNPEKGQEMFYPFLQDEDKDIQLIAVAHLSACGKYAEPLISNYFISTQDPLLKMNMAYGLIGQNVLKDKAIKSLYDGLFLIKDKLNFEDYHHMRILVINKEQRREDFNYTKEENEPSKRRNS